MSDIMSDMSVINTTTIQGETKVGLPFWLCEAVYSCITIYYYNYFPYKQL